MKNNDNIKSSKEGKFSFDKTDSEVENNNFASSRKKISSFSEMMDILNEYKELKRRYDQKETKHDSESIIIREKITELESILSYGIEIDSTILDKYKIKIIDFIKSFGLFSDAMLKPLKKINLTISPVDIISSAELCNYGSFISIDIKYAEFDSNGNFIGVKDIDGDFFIHTFIHELLHSISRKGFIFNDSFSEGLTEYFAHKIAKQPKNFSKSYKFCERFFYMLGLMIGDDLLLEDYLTDINDLKNVNKFVESLNLSKEKFVQLKIIMDNLINIRMQRKLSEEQIRHVEENLCEFVFNEIIMPFCLFDREKALEMKQRVFADDSIQDLCKIQTVNENNKKI